MIRVFEFVMGKPVDTSAFLDQSEGETLFLSDEETNLKSHTEMCAHRYNRLERLLKLNGQVASGVQKQQTRMGFMVVVLCCLEIVRTASGPFQNLIGAMI